MLLNQKNGGHLWCKWINCKRCSKGFAREGAKAILVGLTREQLTKTADQMRIPG